ncbi:MAG: hypothetical protein ABI972_30195 [Acidobacteriota bacterium]
MKKLLAMMLLVGGSVFGQISVGIRIGSPPAPRVVRVRPNSPGPGYLWVDGYWYPANNRYVWHPGYYSRPPYEGAMWVSPRYESQMFYGGYWSGNDRQFQHDHHWDKDKKNRDYNRNNGHSKGKGRGR